MISDLGAAIDDSGTNRESPLTLCAAWLGGADEWDALESSWCEVLQREGPPFDLHAVEFFDRKPDGSLKNRYASWSPEKASRVLQELLNTVMGSRVDPFAHAIDTEDFFSFPRQDRLRLASGATHQAYYLPFQSVIFDLADNTPTTAQVNVIHDCDAMRSGRASAIYHRIKETAPERYADRLGLFSVGRREDYGSLQLADLLAYVIRRAAGAYNLHDDERGCIAVFAKKNPQFRRGVPVFERDRMEQLLAVLRRQDDERN